MKVMILLRTTAQTEAGVMPSSELLTAMGKFNEELVDAGIMLAGEGLHPTSKAARVSFSASAPTVTHGPYDAGTTICGFWMWEVKSMDEAIAWVKRVPNTDGAHGEIEIRPVFEAADFGEAFTPELQEQEEKLRERLTAKG